MWLVTTLQCGITASKGRGEARPETETPLFSEPSLVAEDPNGLLVHVFLICMISPQDSASHGFQEYRHQYFARHMPLSTSLTGWRAPVAAFT